VESSVVPTFRKLETGSTITTFGWNSLISLCMRTRCISSPCTVGREEWMRRRYHRLFHQIRLCQWEPSEARVIGGQLLAYAGSKTVPMSEKGSRGF